jgi:hypothetical protein
MAMVKFFGDLPSTLAISAPWTVISQLGLVTAPAKLKPYLLPMNWGEIPQPKNGTCCWAK